MLQDVLSYSRVGGCVSPGYVSVRAADDDVTWDLGIAGQNMVEVQDLNVYADPGQPRHYQNQQLLLSLASRSG